MLITVEGLDGTGKSTLIDGISKQLKDLVVTKEPGSPLHPLCKQLRLLALDHEMDPVTRELIFYADANLHRHAIKHEQLQGKHVISDRGLWSHHAYLYGYRATKQITMEQSLQCTDVIGWSCAKPDAVIYLQGDIDLMKERLTLGKKDMIERQSSEFFAYVLSAYDDLITDFKRLGRRVLTLNARNPREENVAKAVAFIQFLR